MRTIVRAILVIAQACSIGIFEQSATISPPAYSQTPKASKEKPPRDIDLAPAKRPDPLGSISHSYALIIGIAKYKNLPPSAQLEFTARDADSIYSALTDPAEGNFPAGNVHKLIGEQATYVNILRELEVWLPSVTQDSDRVLIFFAGHGFISADQGWLAPYDVDLNNLASSSLPFTTLSTTMGRRIRGRWKMLLTDACHSGAIDPVGDRKPVKQGISERDQSVFSLTSTRGREQSFESRQWGGGHGVFTYFILRALQGEADINGDGVVDANELSEFVHAHVRSATDGRQNTTSERGSYDPHMVIAFNPSFDVVRNQLPMYQENISKGPRFGNLVIETDQGETTVSVDGQRIGIAQPQQPLKLSRITPGGHLIIGTSGNFSNEPHVEMVYAGEATTVNLHLIRHPVNQVTSTPKQPFASSKPEYSSRSYAVIIGISAYRNLPDSAQLEFPGRDAEAVYDVLTNADGGQFIPENVHKLIDDRATLANIRHELEDWLPSVVTPADHVLIYFAGHGIIRGNAAYFAPFDIKMDDVSGTALSMNSLGRTIDNKIKAKEKVLITDACHSGALTPESDREQLNQKLFDLTSSLYSLTASRDREFSFESREFGGGHGVFTYFVVKGLQGAADANGDGIVDADELSEYVHTSVRQATNGRQNPTATVQVLILTWC